MKMQPDRTEGVNVIARHEAGRVWVAGTTPQPVLWQASVLVPWQGDALAWPVAADASPSADDFAVILALAPEIVIFGSGPKLRFAPPAVLQALYSQRIGVETMDTAAACRTYNVLAGEGRSVVAALLL
jgi:uncharacterized protein